ncbi:MAG: PIN domain-containing protein [Acidobacteria bacterium]|nr:PIN domain-containing protein [Acidobacteriota bacterium]
MIAVDTNILVYAHRQDSPHHRAAKSAVRRLAEGAAPWGIPWPCVHEFLSVTTNPGIFKPPTPPELAIVQVEIWMESPTLRVLGESDGYWTQLRECFLNGKLKGAQVHEARIHSICRASGVRELWSADRDFSRMRNLTIVNPCLT